MTRIILVFALALAQAVTFEPVQPDLFGAGGTFVNAWADYDGDDDPDLFVGFDGAANRLYRNDAGTFADVATEAGVADARPTRAAAWGDYRRRRRSGSAASASRPARRGPCCACIGTRRGRSLT